jgi:predicted ferric reductase
VRPAADPWVRASGARRSAAWEPDREIAREAALDAGREAAREASRDDAAREGTPRGIRMARGFWSLAVPLVLILPLLLSERAGLDGDLPMELALTTGVLGSSALAIAVVSASRVRSVSRAFGIERVLLSHRWFGLFALVLVLTHTGLVLLDNPKNVYLLEFRHAPPRARAATGATIAIILLCLAAVFRRKVKWKYELWRITHVLLALTAIVLTALHVLWLNHLIRDPVMRAWFVGVALVLLLVATQRWVIRPFVTQYKSFVVDEVRVESPQVYTLVLRPRFKWQRGLRFAPGQFAWIRPQGRAGSGWNEHPFTIASNAERPRRLEFTIRTVGDFTRTVSRLKRGARVRVDGPYGSFTVDHRPARGVLLIAGGVGITPMMSILRTLAHREDHRPASLVIAARHEGDLLFRSELAALTRRMPLRVAEVLSSPPENWPGWRGRISAAVLAAALPPGRRRERLDIDAYICGSPGMVETALKSLEELGLPSERIHTEQFEMV